MTLRETTIAKLQQLPDPLLQEVSDLIDDVLSKHQLSATEAQAEKMSQAWLQWFDAVGHLETIPIAPQINYQKLLLEKYRRQGLVL